MSSDSIGQDYSSAVNTARDYYNSDDADHFYHQIWGGEDIHIGLYRSPDEAIATASRRTVEELAATLVRPLTNHHRVLDIGAGYGGAARYLAQTGGCEVVALNLSEAENRRNRELNAEQQLDSRITVVDGNFENVPLDDASVDVVWSQDAILHSGDRPRVIREVVRVLKPGGEFIFSDPMAADDCPPGVLTPILERIHLETLGSPGFYRQTCLQAGLQEVEPFRDETSQLIAHYSRVLEETEKHQAELGQRVSADYIERMKRGLRHWIDGGSQGFLSWGFFHFAKPDVSSEHANRA